MYARTNTHARTHTYMYSTNTHTSVQLEHSSCSPSLYSRSNSWREDTVYNRLIPVQWTNKRSTSPPLSLKEQLTI